MCLAGCSSDDPVSGSEPEEPKENGEVIFDVKIPEGYGDATTYSPATVGKGERLEMAVSQTSSYTDPDGTVFTCRPKAEIVLYAKLDTVVAKDVASLTKVKDGSDVKSGTDGTSPVRHTTVQTFEIGGQDIVFDLSHEVYTYVNSRKDKIEMPYIKINRAKFGSAAADEEQPQGRSVGLALSGISIRPVAPSRTSTITDSTMYEVNALFNLDIETMNAKSDKKQNLVFSVSYIGIVETTTELKDPESSVSYKWEVKSGTNSQTSPFVKTIGEPMEVWMSQSSRYSDEYGNEYVADPKAKIKITVANDTIWTDTLDELKIIENKTGEISRKQSATQIFGSGTQDITIDWSYDVAAANPGEKEVSMPYYALDGAVLKDISIAPLDYAIYQGKEADLYEVALTFSQTATPENITGTAVAEEIEYVVSYIAAVEIKLVKVEYFPGGKWMDPQGDLHLAYFANVTRRRTYSNGAVQEDKFADYGHTAIATAGRKHKNIKVEYGDDWEIYYPANVSITGDSVYIRSQSYEVSRLGKYKLVPIVMDYTSSPLLTWDEFSLFTPYDSGLSVGVDLENPLFEKDSRDSGWYLGCFDQGNEYQIHGSFGDDDGFFPIGILECSFFCHVQFLIIDGYRIDFSKLHNFKINYDLKERDFEDDDKAGKIYTLELHASYMNKNFYSANIDSVFVRKNL